jgi:hypothetical protein
MDDSAAEFRPHLTPSSRSRTSGFSEVVDLRVSQWITEREALSRPRSFVTVRYLLDSDHHIDHHRASAWRADCNRIGDAEDINRTGKVFKMSSDKFAK